MKALAWIGLVVFSTAICGDALLQIFSIRCRSAWERFIAGAALGIGIWMLTLFAVGLVAFTKTSALFHLCPFFLAALFHLRSYFQAMRGKGFRLFRNPLFWSGMPLFVLILGIGLIASFAPVADMSDALTYHLNLPKEYVWSGKIVSIAFDVNNGFPLLMSMGFGFGLLFGCESFANLLALWMSLLCGGLVYGWTRRFAGSGPAILAALTFLCIPVVYNHLITPYVDIAMALYACLSFFYFLEWVARKEKNLLGLSGAFAGLALGTKFLEAFYVVALLAGIVAVGIRRRLGWREILSGCMCFIFWCAALGGIWYVRSAWLMGNPVYPFLARWFRGAPPTFTWDVYSQGLGTGRGLISFATLFWNATFHSDIYFLGFGTRWNVILLAMLPLVIWDRFRFGLDGLTVGTLIALILWFFSVQVMRFLFPFFVLYAVMMGRVWKTWFGSRRLMRFLLMAWVLLVGCWETAVFATHNWPAMRVGLGLQTREQFLMQRERSYPMAHWVDEHLPKDVKILCSGEGRMYYYDRPMVRDHTFRAFTGYHTQASNATDVLKTIRNYGFTHVLVCRIGLKDGRQATRTEESRRFSLEELVRDTNAFDLLHIEEYTDKSGNIFRYELYAIKG